MTIDDKDNRQDFYSKVATNYDHYAVERLGYKAHELVPKRLLELHNKQSGTVLDLACGTGLASLPFFEAGFDVIGIDYSPGMIEVARSRPYKELFCQSVEDELPVENSSFEIVTAIGVWEFIKDPARLLQQIWNKLTANGIAGITIPQKTEAESELGIRSYVPDDFIQLIDKRQFEIIDRQEFYGWESGHLAEIVGEKDAPHHRVDYTALFLEKRQ